VGAGVPPALLPAIALLAGAVVGTSVDVSPHVALPLLPLLSASAVVAWWRAAGRTACVLVVSGFGLGSALFTPDLSMATLAANAHRNIGANVIPRRGTRAGG